MVKRLTKILVAAAIALGGTAAPLQAFQSAPPGVSVDTYYYADWAETQLVGHYRDYCDGSSNGWGQVSEYSRIYYYGC